MNNYYKCPLHSQTHSKNMTRQVLGKKLANEIVSYLCAHHSMTLKCMRILDHITPNFNADGCIICGYEKILLI